MNYKKYDKLDFVKIKNEKEPFLHTHKHYQEGEKFTHRKG